ncbi:hypothetical protein TanjilG_29424 [Lupinus angustifolius]|uniref:B box-type domain-containing protein n=1 Tax=Lupinus angustifolius TaxID=3871 RepID=A0A4P1R691_LUPAN|nr:PREDICTED: uncharacterized protein LOC109360895 [Lupinus angustifolius]OIW02648.1 hypothetical protein TanjilG_29424 [Lupinus angustifolius]
MMSASSSRKVKKNEQVAQCKVNKPRWLDALLGETFFDSCEAHPFRRNELNQYCINCNQPACRFCVSSGPHDHHQILQIYRYVYRDAVYLSDMKKFIDCSGIQPYKCNSKWVISLNPLPHNGSAVNYEASCSICSRKLTEPHKYSYCSISCKVKAVLEKPNDSFPPFISIQSPSHETQEETSEPQMEEATEQQNEETSKPQSLRKRRRKGTPHRAPFF